MCSIDFVFMLNSDSDTCSIPKHLKVQKILPAVKRNVEITILFFLSNSLNNKFFFLAILDKVYIFIVVHHQQLYIYRIMLL